MADVLSVVTSLTQRAVKEIAAEIWGAIEPLSFGTASFLYLIKGMATDWVGGVSWDGHGHQI